MKLIIYTERVRRRGGTYKSSDEWKIMSSSFLSLFCFPFFFFFFCFYFISHSSTILLVLDLYQSKVSLNCDRNKREKEMMEKLWIVKLPRSETKNDEYKCQLCMNNPCATKWTISQILTIISWMPFSFFFFFIFVLLPSIQSWSKKQSIFSFFFCLHFKTKSLSYQIKKQEKKERNIWTTKMKNMKQMHEHPISVLRFFFSFSHFFFLFDQWLTENKREKKYERENGKKCFCFVAKKNRNGNGKCNKMTLYLCVYYGFEHG